MNILILNWRCPKNPKSGGAEIVTMEHAKAWVKAGHSVTWFTSTFQECKKEEIIDGVKFIRRGSSIGVYVLAPFYFLKNKDNFDVVVDEIHGLPFFTPLYVKKPKIAFIHEVANEIWDYMFPFPVNKIGRTIEPLYFKLYKNVKFWTDASSTIDDLEKYGIQRKNCKAINCPISVSSTVTMKKIKKPEKEKKPTFIFVSRVVKMKGIEEVIRAFFYILRELKDANLWIVGDGDPKYVQELRETMKSYSIAPKVKFFGRVSEEEKFRLMGRAHLLLHASVKEGWGLVVIEAASQRTPSVVYNVAGLRDSVKNRKTGIVLKENNAKELAKQAIKLLQDKSSYQAFQKNGVKWAQSLRWDDLTKDSLILLKNIATKT